MYKTRYGVDKKLLSFVQCKNPSYYKVSLIKVYHEKLIPV